MTLPQAARRLATLAPLPLLVALLGACGPGSTDDGAVETRAVDTVIGQVDVPLEIDSVVVLEGRRDLDIALALDLPLVGYPYEGPDSGLDLPGPLADELAASGAEELFLADEVDVEAIAEVAPSLIIGRLEDVEPIREELEAIAPVLPVSTFDDGVTWQQDLTTIAEATGTSERAEELLAEYDARLAEVRETHASRIADTSVVALGYDLEGTEVEAGRLQSLVLADLGALPAAALREAYDEDAGEGLGFSPEQTLQTYQDAEALLVLADTEDEWAAAQEDPLFAQLPAVRAGAVVRSDKMTHEGGPLTALHVLDLVEQMYGLV